MTIEFAFNILMSIAAAAIEAQAPGSVPNMTFAQVMLQAKRAGRDRFVASTV